MVFLEVFLQCLRSELTHTGIDESNPTAEHQRAEREAQQVSGAKARVENLLLASNTILYNTTL
jgi:hypothetical protein